ncbi:MAG TPA: LPS assembly lipoprotein LptE [Dongiaceae bacterium]|nr:LPS assembly lipoprotein LptE [Dongiaceae bacterium]
MNLSRLVWLVSVTLLLTACGFQLRGVEHSIESRYENMRVTNASKDEQFAQTLRQSLKNAGVTLNENASAKVEILSTRNEKRTASYSSRAKSAEFELVKTVTFRFRNDNQEVIADMPLQARRSYLYRETAAVGKAEEESLLWQEMNQDLAQRILMALQRTVPEGKSKVAEPSSDNDAATAPAAETVSPAANETTPTATSEPAPADTSTTTPTEATPAETTPVDPTPANTPPSPEIPASSTPESTP